MGQFDAFLDELNNKGELQKEDPYMNANPSTDPIMDSVLDDARKQEVNNIKGVLFKIKDKVPNSYSESAQLAKDLNLPVDLADRNKEELKIEQRMKALQGVLDNQPSLRTWAMEDPMALARANPDELEKVSGLSWLLQSTSQSYQSGLDQNELGTLRFKEIDGTATPQDNARADYLSHKWMGRNFGAKTWFQKSVVYGMQQVPIWLDPAAYGVETAAETGLAGAAVGAGAAFVGGQMGPQVAAPEEVVTVPAAALAMGIRAGQAGFTAGTYERMSAIQTGLAYDEFKYFKDENGDLIEPGVAKVAALISGFTSGALEQYGFSKVMSKIPGMDKVMGHVGKDAMKEALRNPSVRATLANVAKNVFESGATEVSTEVLQQLVQLTSGEVAKSIEGGKFEYKSPGEWANEVGQVALQTLQVMTVMGPLMSSPRMLMDLSSARKAKATKESLDKVAEVAPENDLVKRDPEIAQKAVDAMAKDSPNKEVHIPADQAVELFQDDPQGIYDFGKNIEGWDKRVNEAVSIGGDISVSIGEYYAYIAPSKWGKEFSNISKFSSEDMTFKESEKLSTSMENAVASLVKTMNVKPNVSQSPEDQVFSDVRNKAQIAGIKDDIAKSYATLYREFFSVMADRTGLNPKELYDRYNFRIEQPQVDYNDGPGNTYNQVVKGEDGYYYHSTNQENSFGIRDSGRVKTFKPNHGTGQKSWPDGSTEKRSYWNIDPEITKSFAPAEGKPVLLRTRIPMKTERTGDSYSTKPIKSDKVEFLSPDGTWQPISMYEQGKRGSITFGSTETVIRLFKAQNLSTFIHESGHLFLKVMEDLASSENAPQQIKDDWQVIKDKMGFTDSPTVEAHEKFAKTFEAYVMEGKTPSIRLYGVFQRMRAWLLAVYRHVRRIGEYVSPEIRQVFDRMLAADWAIENAKLREEFKPSLKEENLSKEEWNKYNSLVQGYVNRSKDDLSYHLIKDLAIKARDEIAVVKREIKAKVKEQLKNSKLYKTVELTKRGTELHKPIKIDREAVVAKYGEQTANSIPKGVLGTNDSIHPDDAAQLMGWESTDEMVAALAAYRPFNVAVNEETSRLVQEKFGDKFKNAESVVQEAIFSMHSDYGSKLLEIEIKALNKMGGKNPMQSPSKMAKYMAQERMNKSKIKSLDKFKGFIAAERNAARRADIAISEGRYSDAAEEKRKQLFSHTMGSIAKDYIREVEKMRSYAIRTFKSPPRMGADYVDQIKAVLGRFELIKVSNRDLDRRVSLLAFIQKQEEEGNVTTIPSYVLNEANKTNFKELTLEEFRGVVDTIKNIEHLGRLKQKYKVKRAALAFDTVKNEMINGLSKQRKLPESPNITPTKLENIKTLAGGIDSSFLKIEQMVAWLDGGDINGPARKYVWQPIADAEVRKNDLMAEYTAKVAQIFEGVDSGRMNERFFIKEVNKNFTLQDMYGVALNMGSFSNYDKMKRGEGKVSGGREWTDEDVQSIVSHLTKEDWDRIQKIWDVIDSLWVNINLLERKLTGVSPKKVESRPVLTRHGEYRGGYYPLVYDSSRATDVANREGLSNEKTFVNTLINLTTPHGHTMERSKNYAAPLSYNLQHMANHMNSVIHDLTHREAVREVNKLLTNSDVAAQIRSILGEPYREEFTAWVRFIAHERSGSDQNVRAIEKFLKKMRMNATMVGIGFRLTTVLAQPIGIVQAMEMVNPNFIAKGVKDSLADPMGTWNFVRSMSGEIRHRSDQLDRDVREGIISLDKFKSFHSEIQRMAYFGVAMADRMVVIPVWMGAYHEHLSKNINDQEGAVAYADRVVRLTQGSGGMKDLARIQRGSELQKLLTMFYSYFSALYSRGRNLTRDSRHATMEDIPHLAARVLFLSILPSILGDIITGGGPADGEDWLKWAARKMLLYPLSAVPFLRDVASYYNTGEYSPTPAARAVKSVLGFTDSLVKIAKEVYHGDVKESTARGLVKNSLLTTGYVFGLPTGQLATSTSSIWKSLEKGDLQLSDLFMERQK